jgi:hypothetical protein
MTQPAAISGTAAVTATLTVNTTAASAAALHNPLERNFAIGGGGTLAVLLFFCLPLRRRKWQTLLSMLVFSAIAAASIGCVSDRGIGLPGGGTSAGSYIVTVTGTSGSVTATTLVNVTVE